MKIQCAWCNSEIGEKQGNGTTHTICINCVQQLNRDSGFEPRRDYEKFSVQDYRIGNDDSNEYGGST